MRVRHPVLLAVAYVAAMIVLFQVGRQFDGRPAVLRVLDLVAGLAVPALIYVAWLYGRESAEYGARHAHRRLEVLEDTGNAVVWEIDPDGHITYVGGPIQDLLGYTADEAKRMTIYDLLPECDRDAVAARLAAGQGWHRAPLRRVGADGSDVWLRSSAVAQVGPHGEVLGFTGSADHLADNAFEEEQLAAALDDLHRVLRTEDITIAFQPIISLTTGELLGVEALSRFPLSTARSPQEWFELASKLGLGTDLETLAARRALTAAASLPNQGYVSINLSPDSIMRPGLLELLTSTSIDPRRVVIEITEHASVRDYDRLKRPVQALRRAGIRLAVDDAGAGYSSFRHILDLSPEFIKLDLSLIRGIDRDPARRALAAAVVMFALEMNATVTAEGVERAEELAVVQSLAIDAAQGYLLGRPNINPTAWAAWTEPVSLPELAATATDPPARHANPHSSAT